MWRNTAIVSAFTAAVLTACSGDENLDPNPENLDPGIQDSGVTPDLGVPPTPDAGQSDAGQPDAGQPDAGPRDGGSPDGGPPPAPQTVAVRGRLRTLGGYLAGNNVYVGQASVLAFGVTPPVNTLTQAAPQLGAYTVILPTNGQVVMVTTGGGYNQTFWPLTTGDQDLVDYNLYLAESAWLEEIAQAHNVDLGGSFPCQTQSLAGQTCVYTSIVGRILDDGAAGQGERRPVGGIPRTAITFEGPDRAPWAVRGPYFLDYTGTSSSTAQNSVVYNDNGNYRGGLYIVFAELSLAAPQPFLPFELRIEWNDGGRNRYFGPTTVQGFRAANTGVNWANIVEAGVPPPPPPVGNIDFDTQVYPLTLPVNQGGLGCQACHSGANGAVPTGNMDLYGAETAYAALTDSNYPDRVNINNPDASLLLTKPLYPAADHPIFAFASPQDAAYQLIRTWIAEGAIRNPPVILPDVSFVDEIRPLLYNDTQSGGLGCVSCHNDAVNQTGGFYVGGDGNALYDELVNEASNNGGRYNEPYRINRGDYPERSLVLANPNRDDQEPHPVKILAGNIDPAYQKILLWIVQGYVNDTP